MSSFAAKLWLLIWCATFSLFQVANASVFGIGARRLGDQLLMKDIAKTTAITLTEETVITFNYAIPQPITYIEMISDEDIYVSLDFSYENDLVNGTIRKKVHDEVTIEPIQNHDPFEVLIQIYGYFETPYQMDTKNFLNRGQTSSGGNHKSHQPSVQKPKGTSHFKAQKPKETLSLMFEDTVALEEFDDIDSEFVHQDKVAVALDKSDDSDDNMLFPVNRNKIIQMGNRQRGDYLLYEADQTSLEGTELPTNHTVLFYYIDNNFITYVEFTIFDYFLEHPLTSDDYQSPTVAFEKISPHTLKAIVTDHRTKSLFVQMQVYGYEPNDKPVAFQSYLTSGQQIGSNNNNDNNADADAWHDDVEYVCKKLTLTSKRRTHVHFNSVQAPTTKQQESLPPPPPLEDTYNSNDAQEEEEALENDVDGVGQLVICNWLITMMTTTTVVLFVATHMPTYC
uniref:Uncharacterized protein n=1 Tax=Stomoxys calcitrans TaxID=35570 RepID=A0A1I8P6J6_STOCA